MVTAVDTTDAGLLDQAFHQPAFAPPCESYNVPCENTAVAIMVFKRECGCASAKPHFCEGCLREVLEILESMPKEFAEFSCLICKAPVEYITWYYF